MLVYVTNSCKFSVSPRTGSLNPPTSGFSNSSGQTFYVNDNPFPGLAQLSLPVRFKTQEMMRDFLNQDAFSSDENSEARVADHNQEYDVTKDAHQPNENHEGASFMVIDCTLGEPVSTLHQDEFGRAVEPVIVERVQTPIERQQFESLQPSPTPEKEVEVFGWKLRNVQKALRTI